MRFLRESAVEQVLHGRDDAARNQQGDVRRMSRRTSSAACAGWRARRRRWRSRSRATRVVAVALDEPGRLARALPAMRCEPLPAGAVDAGAERAERARRGGADRGGARPCSTGCRRGRGASRWCCPTPSPRCRWCASRRCRRKPQDLDQLIRWQVRKAAPFRIEDAQVSWQSRASRCPAAAASSSSRSPAATSSRATSARARRPACTPGIVDLAQLQPDQRRAGRRRPARRATGCS